MSQEQSIGKLLSNLSHQNVITFVGYSGQGYENESLARAQMSANIIKTFETYGNPIAVVSGATPEGIGMVYEVAKGMKVTNPEITINTYGIVSSAVKEYGFTNPNVDAYAFIDRPAGDWTVENEQGKSYTVESVKAGKNGHIVAYGGGEIAKKEFIEALDAGLTGYYVNHSPSSTVAAKKMEKAALKSNGGVALSEQELSEIQQKSQQIIADNNVFKNAGMNPGCYNGHEFQGEMYAPVGKIEIQGLQGLSQPKGPSPLEDRNTFQMKTKLN